jgi:uncharacterized membrane protein
MAVEQPAIEAPAPAIVIPSDRRMANLISLTLRIGVLASAALIILGLVIYAINDGDPKTVDDALGKNGEIPQVRPSTILDGLADGSPSAFIELGILVLILTPIVRVALTTWLFERKRDWIFVGLAGFVLIVLLLGLFGIGA